VGWGFEKFQIFENEDVTDNRQDQIMNAFQRCGMLNAIDVSEDHLIKVQGYDGPYTLESDDEDSEVESDGECSGDSDVRG